ncbi:hypothetical protein M8J77_020128 [Diaphorina citri]|nr:hypothetical protein M8J77_020128 [Diaphorina citri]
MNPPTTLSILAWNSNGLLKNKLELQLLLEQQNIDIVLISETHTTHESVCKINKYKFYHAMHPSNKPWWGWYLNQGKHKTL